MATPEQERIVDWLAEGPYPLPSPFMEATPDESPHMRANREAYNEAVLEGFRNWRPS